MVDVIGSVFSVWYKGIRYVIHAYVSTGAGIGLGMESAVDVVERFFRVRGRYGSMAYIHRAT